MEQGQLAVTTASSKQQAFTKKHRLFQKKSYSQVFSNPCKVKKNRYFSVLMRKNQEGAPRLGVIAAKKYVKKAVDRNQIKRLVREVFRKNRGNLKDADFVVIAKNVEPERFYLTKNLNELLNVFRKKQS